MNNFFELLKTRRSIRKYVDKAVEPEKIEKICKAALMSPASKSRNPWEFVVVENKETLQKLSKSRKCGSSLIGGAPLAIVVLADTTISDVWFEDASIATIILQLQAHDLGLGSCWVQIYLREQADGVISEEYVRELLNVPDQFAVLSIVAIGYAESERTAHDEENLMVEKIHKERF